MKKYIEPEIQIIEYRLTDIISASQPHGYESGNEIDTSSESVNPETSIPDLITPTDDEWW